MPKQSNPVAQPSYFDLHVEGLGYLNRIRVIKPKKGQEFLACTVAALRGSNDDVAYTYFDCKVSGNEAKEIVMLLKPEVEAKSAVLIGFKLGDVYPEIFTFEKGSKEGQPGVSIKGRLLRVKFAKVNGEHVALPQSERSDASERAAA